MLILQRYGPLLGRILLSAIFILSGVGKITNPSFDGDQMKAKGIPAVTAFLILALIAEIAGGISILTGTKARSEPWACLCTWWLSPSSCTTSGPTTGQS